MKFLIIEDDLDVFEVVSMILETQWPDVIVAHASMGVLGVELVETEEPEVIILDIGLPDIDGFEVCSRIRVFSGVPIIMLTVRNTTEDIIRGLELGADDYVIKPFRPAELLARIDAILRRIEMTRMRDLDMVFEQSGLTIDFSNGQVSVNGEFIRLSLTEYQLLHHLVSNPGELVTSQVLLDYIWGEEYRDRPHFLIPSVARLKTTLQDYPNTQNMILQEESGGYSSSLPEGNGN